MSRYTELYISIDIGQFILKNKSLKSLVGRQNMAQVIPKHFSEILRDNFYERSLRNPSYSLRAYARDLNLSPGNLTDVLAQKTGLSNEKALYIAEVFNLENEDKEFFCKLVEANSARKKEDRKTAEAELWKYDTQYNKISDDYFQIISTWHHFAIAELVAIKDFIYDHEWMSKRLNISVEEIKFGLERLINVGLLVEHDGKLSQNYDFFVSPSGTPSDAAKKFHQQVIAKASEAIINQSIEERDFSSGIYRVRRDDLPEISREIKEFRRKLGKWIEAGENHDSVYALSIQLFRADQDI
jgi:uncharacterized protein (TIGR02147 family)